MLDTFKARLRAKAKAWGVNLSTKRIDALADRLHKKNPDLTDEADHDSRIDDLNEITPLEDMAKQDDRIRSLETKAKAQLPKKEEQHNDDDDDDDDGCDEGSDESTSCDDDCEGDELEDESDDGDDDDDALADGGGRARRRWLSTSMTSPSGAKKLVRRMPFFAGLTILNSPACCSRERRDPAACSAGSDSRDGSARSPPWRCRAPSRLRERTPR